MDPSRPATPLRAALLAPLLVATPALAALSAADEEPSEFVDHVATLELSETLDARGNLGGMTVDALGFLYVANFRDAVWRIDLDGSVETLTRSLYGASGNAVDSKGDLYQANFNGGTITRITRTGEVTTFAEGLDGPVGIALDEDDTLFVCNCQGNTLSRVSPEGKVSTFAESELFACPNGIAFADDGNLYITNFNSHDLLRVSPTGEVERFVTVPGGAGNAHLEFSKGFFYVTKIMANRVARVSLDGEISTLAGTGQPGHQDGPALEATFHRPNGIAVSPRGGRLYVNTLVGEYNQPDASKITIRTIEIMTLTRALDDALEHGGLDELVATYRQYKTDPIRGQENTVGEMVAYGYRFLSSRQLNEAVTIFELNVESYPDVAAAQFHLGEAYRYLGQTERALEQYEKTLALDPEHAGAQARRAILLEE